MPTLVSKRGKKRYKGVKTLHGDRREKLFPDATKRSYRAAVAWEEIQEKEMKTPSTSSHDHAPACSTLGEWAVQYLAYAERKYTTKTFDEKRRVFRRFFEMTDRHTLCTALSQGDVLRFLQQEMDDRSGNQANRARKNLVAGWNWGMRYMSPPLPGPNPAMVERMPEHQKERYVPPEGDFWKVFDVCDDPQDRAMLMTALHTAARRSEIFRLRRQDIDLENDQLRLWTRKRRSGSWEYDWIPLTAALRSELLAWMETRLSHEGTDPEHLFVNLDRYQFSTGHYGKPFKNRQHWMKRMCSRASVPPFGFHAIRHLTASILFRHGEPLEVIQRILRHKSATTTNRYLHSIGAQHIRAAMDDALVRPDAEIIDLKRRKEP